MSASLTAQKKRHDNGNGDAWLRGGQTVAHTFDMIIELMRKVIIPILVWLMICWAIANNAAPDKDQIYAGLFYIAWLYKTIGKPLPDTLGVPDETGAQHPVPAEQYFHLPYAVDAYNRYFGYMWEGFWLFVLGNVAILGALSVWFINHGYSKLESKEIRGQEIVDLGTLLAFIRSFNNKRIAQLNTDTLIKLGLPPSSNSSDGFHALYMKLRGTLESFRNIGKSHDVTFDRDEFDADADRYNRQLIDIKNNTDVPHKLLADPRWADNDLKGFERQVLHVCDKEAKAAGLPFYARPADFKTPKLARIPYPFGAHLEHTLVVGGTGSGKSVALHHLIDSIKDRGDCAVIYDPEGEFIRAHFRQGIDKIFNPFDVRSVGWSPYADLETLADWISSAQDLFPEPKTGDPYWTHSSRTVYSYAGFLLGVKMRETQNRNPTIFELLNLLSGEQHVVYEHVKGTAAGVILGEKSGPRSDSLRSVMLTGIERMAHLLGGTEDFSIKSWVNDPKERGFLFLTAPESLAATIRPVLAHVSSLGVTALLSRTPEQSKKETWLIFDEFNSLGKMDSLAEAPTRLRKFGGAVVLGMQQVSQPEETYGEPKMRTIVGQLRNKLILGCNDPRTGEFMSEMLGEREVIRIEETTSYGANNIRDGVGLAPKTSVEPIAMPEQLMNLPSMTGYLKFSPGAIGQPLPVSIIKYNYVPRKTMAEPFIPHTRQNLVEAAFLAKLKPAEDPNLGGKMSPDQDVTTFALTDQSSSADNSRTEHEAEKEATRKDIENLAPSQTEAARSAPQETLLTTGSTVELTQEDQQALDAINAERRAAGKTILQGLNQLVNGEPDDDYAVADDFQN